MSTIVVIAAVVEAFADLVLALVLAGVAYYVFDILRKAQALVRKVKREGEEIIDEIEVAREDARESAIGVGAGLAAEIIADMLMKSREKRKRPHD